MITRRALNFWRVSGVSFALWLAANSSFACSVCFGDPNSDMVRGAKAGVLFLAAIIYLQLMLMGGVAATWIVRARRLRREEAQPADSPHPPSLHR